MFKRCVSLFSLTISSLLFAIAAVRAGFDLYQRTFTKEEVLLLVGALIAALIAFLIGKLAEPTEAAAETPSGGSSGSGAAFSRPVTAPMCMTCEFWHGQRRPDPKSRQVVADSGSSPGTCIHRGSTYKASRKAAAPPCESYEAWRLLA